jgi:hypothetical protein
VPALVRNNPQPGHDHALACREGARGLVRRGMEGSGAGMAGG